MNAYWNVIWELNKKNSILKQEIQIKMFLCLITLNVGMLHVVLEF